MQSRLQRKYPSLMLACLFALLPAVQVAAAELPYIVLQSTLSTQSSGLFDDLLPRFTAAAGIAVKVVAVSTEQALKNATDGDGDVVLVHAAEAEKAFVDAGDGLARLPLMYNEFIVVGPQADPAGGAQAASAGGVFARIAQFRAPFISRGDNSDTHQRERELWQAASLMPDPGQDPWYQETRSDMLPTFKVAIEGDAYTLIDRATWLTVAEHKHHRVLFEGGPALRNQYSLILVNPRRHPAVHAAEARIFVEWLLSPTGQEVIAGFRPHGQQLFFPNRGTHP